MIGKNSETLVQVKTFLRNSDKVNLKELKLTGAPLDEKSLAAVCNFLRETTELRCVVFNGTLLTKEGHNRLLEALADNTSLEKVSLSHCLLSDENELSLKNLISRHPRLRFLDISSHSSHSVQGIDVAIQGSKSLEAVLGLTLSENAKTALEQNKRIASLKNKLADWQSETNITTKNDVILDVRKKLFYKQVNDIRKINKKDLKRLNPLIAAFYWYLAKEFQALGNIEQAQVYFNRYITFNPDDKSAHFQAHWEMMNMLFTRAGELNAQLHPAGQELNADDKDELLSLQSHYFNMADELFKKATAEAQTAEDKAVLAAQSTHIVPVIAEHFIEKGETDLTSVNNGSSTFTRKYEHL